MLKKGFTKSAAQSIPEIKRLQGENPDVAFYAGIAKHDISYADFDKKAIFISISKSNIENITTALHELGHYRNGYRTKNIINNEAMAWFYALEYANSHKYPFSKRVAYNAFMTYLEAYIACKRYYDKNIKRKKKVKEETYLRFYQKTWLKDFYYCSAICD